MGLWYFAAPGSGPHGEEGRPGRGQRLLLPGHRPGGGPYGGAVGRASCARLRSK